jgi:phage terminase large subunit-like protein
MARRAAGEETALKSWRLACPDWQTKLRAGRSLVPALPLNLKKGNQAVAVFNKLRLADVPTTPTLGEAGGEWFREIVRALFGSLDPKTRVRAIRELFLLVPKKNSKTTNGALLMLTALLLNERPRAPFIMTAPVQDVADLAFSAASGAIALDPVLSKLLHVREHLKTIIHRETKAELQIMTFDPAVVTGQKVVGALIDELHVVAKMSKAASAIRQLRGGMLPFPEAFLAFITTQSEDAPAGAFKSELMKARAIRDGRQDGAMLPVLYEFPQEMQKDGAVWRNPKNWSMVTPNAGRSVSIERLKEDFATAEASGEEELRAWASQHLNVEIGLALHSDRWAGADFWEQQGREGLTLDEILKRSDVVTVGIDGGGLDDLLGLMITGRDRETREWLAWAHAWAHKIVLERRKDISGKLRDLRRGRRPDDRQCARRGRRAGGRHRVPHPGRRAPSGEGGDRRGPGRHRRRRRRAVRARSARIKAEQIVGISQGWKLSGAIKTTERKIAGNELVHCAQPLMAWCVSNAKVEPKGNAMLITKQASGSAKIDPLMALFDAVSLMSLNPTAGAKKYQLFTV